MSIENICNQALDLVGHKRHIGSVYDGSPAARIALNAYSETRDEVLASQPWQFARDFEVLVPAGPDAPLPMWLHHFVYPARSVQLLDVYPSGLAPEDILDPAPLRWLEVTDRHLAAPQRGILTNFSPAMSIFTARIVDTDAWPAEFTRSVIYQLAQKFTRSLGGGDAPKQSEQKQ